MKDSVVDLAIFGRPPAFDRQLHVGLPNLGNRARFVGLVNDMLDRRWLTNNGPYVQEFERQIEKLLGVKHCVAVCNGTIALEIVARATGLSGQVIVPSFTFVATAHALQWQEITPVFCDVDAHTHNLDPNRVEDLITPRTTGIIGVHVWGEPSGLEDLANICERRNLKLIYDGAHAFGCSYKGRMIGNFGIAEVLSFHATKFFHTFEGGAIVSNDDELVGKIRLMKNFGFEGYDNVIYIGTNGKMPEVCAAMGLAGLESLDDHTTCNRRNYESYKSALKDVPGVRLFEYDESELRNYQYIVVEIDDTLAPVSRDELVQVLHAENVLARRYFYPGCHKMEPYRSLFPHAGLLLPETERLVKRVLQLPNGETLSPEEIREICNIIRIAVTGGESIRGRLAQLNLRMM